MTNDQINREIDAIRFSGVVSERQLDELLTRVSGIDDPLKMLATLQRLAFELGKKLISEQDDREHYQANYYAHDNQRTMQTRVASDLQQRPAMQ